MVSTDLLRLLAAAIDNPEDEGLLGVLCDCLINSDQMPQAWRLHGLCIHCGGNTAWIEQLDNTICESCERSITWFTESCCNARHSNTLRLWKVARELGYKQCQYPKHHPFGSITDWTHNRECSWCDGTGLVHQ